MIARCRTEGDLSEELDKSQDSGYDPYGMSGSLSEARLTRSQNVCGT